MTHATFFSYFKSEIEKLLDQKLTEKAEITVLLKKLAITSVRDLNQFIDQSPELLNRIRYEFNCFSHRTIQSNK